MTVPPLPASPCVRVRLDYTGSATEKAGSRFYLSYAGSPPTGADCNAIALAIGNAWGTHIGPEISNYWGLSEVDVLDIATHSGNSGNSVVGWSSSGGTNEIPASAAINVEFDIARRYRGGKPRMFFPPADASNLGNPAQWTSGFVTGMNTAVAAYFAAVEAISVGAVGALAHVNLSYFQGFTNHANTSGRERAVPTYRDTALVDLVTGYATKQVVGSQRRRRTSTTF